MRILVVDDSGTSRLLLRSMLQNAGYEDVGCAESGYDCLDQLTEALRPGDRPYDLVIMDINMPGLNGLETTRRIKAQAPLQALPVIMVSISDDLQNVELAFETGAIDYINKPVNRIELIVRVGAVLRLKAEMDRRKTREGELETLTRRLQQLTNLDGLTGAVNRRFFDEALDVEWRRCRRENKHLALLLANIDFFRHFNELYGHLEGDNCLKAIAHSIRRALKRPGDLVARYDGDAFAVVLPRTDLAGARIIAADIAARIAELAIPHADVPTGPCVTLSIGLTAQRPSPVGSPDMLLRAATEAVHQAKSSGRARISTKARPIELHFDDEVA